MRPARSQPKRPSKAAVKRLATPCRCGKLGYETENGAMDAVISGSYARAGVRVYQCETGLWHTTSKQRVQQTTFTESTAPVRDLSDEERTLIHAVRFMRSLRARGVKGQEMLDANNALQAAMTAAVKAG